LKEYARAVEYPIAAVCSVGEYAGSVQIEPGLRRPITFLEAAGIKNLLRIEQDLSELDDSGLIKGWVVETFLADKSGCPVLSNQEGSWEYHSSNDGTTITLEDYGGHVRPTDVRLRVINAGSRKPANAREVETVICADGIRIANRWYEWSPPTDTVPSAELMDSRGQRKPRLTPAREPIRTDAGWSYLWKLERRARKRILTKLSEFLPDRLCYDHWRKLVDIYNFNVGDVPDDIAWEHVPVRILPGGYDASENNEPAKYVPLSEIEHVEFQQIPGIPNLVTKQGIVALQDTRNVLRFAELRNEGETWELRVRRSPDVLQATANWYVGGLSTYAVPFAHNLRNLLCAWLGATLVNSCHPLMVRAHQLSDTKLRDFLFALLLPDPLSPEELPPFKLKYRRAAGEKYLKLSRKLDPALAPPYKTYSSSTGWGEITDAQLREWAKIQIDEDT